MLQLQHLSFQWIFRTDFFWDGLVGPPCCPRDSQESSPTLQFKRCSAFFYSPTLTFIHTTGKTIALTRQTFASNVISQLFNMLSRLVITFLQKSKRLLISWLQSPSAVILEAKKIKSITLSIVFLSICHEVMGLDVIMFVSLMLSFKPNFSLS